MTRWSAAALVVTSMIGTGVFTTTGFLLRDLGSPSAVLALWLIGGLVAAAGAVSYAELSSVHPRNGGEFALIGRVFHPAAGFVAGFVGVFAGFAGPIAASSLAFGGYLAVAVPGVPELPAALALIAATALVQGWDPGVGRPMHLVVTAVEVALIAAFLAFGLTHPSPEAADGPRIGGAGAAATGLVFVSYAYSGWNSVAYVAGELRDPQRDGPWAVFVGTGVVTALYVALNAAFLASAPASALAGQAEVGAVAATAWFGDVGGRVVAALIAWCLATMVLAMFESGPRLVAAIGDEVPALRPLAARNARGAPVRAVALLGVAAATMAAGASFERLLTWMGLLLAASSAVVVLGVPWRRWREPHRPAPFRAPLHPLTPLAYVGVTAWMIAFAVRADPTVGAAAVGLAAAGFGLWWALDRAGEPPR